MNKKINKKVQKLTERFFRKNERKVLFLAFFLVVASNQIFPHFESAKIQYFFDLAKCKKKSIILLTTIKYC